MRIIKSNKLSDIITVSQRSAEAKTEIRIIELSSLGDLIRSEEAEAIRVELRDQGIKVRQLTNEKQLGAWTSVDGFIEACMNVRYVSSKILPIKAEVLIFDDTVAIYRVKPEINVLIIEDIDFANEQRALFDAVWEHAEQLDLHTDGSTRR